MVEVSHRAAAQARAWHAVHDPQMSVRTIADYCDSELGHEAWLELSRGTPYEGGDQEVELEQRRPVAGYLPYVALTDEERRRNRELPSGPRENMFPPPGSERSEPEGEPPVPPVSFPALNWNMSCGVCGFSPYPDGMLMCTRATCQSFLSDEAAAAACEQAYMNTTAARAERAVEGFSPDVRMAAGEPTAASGSGQRRWIIKSLPRPGQDDAVSEQSETASQATSVSTLRERARAQSVETKSRLRVRGHVAEGAHGARQGELLRERPLY